MYFPINNEKTLEDTLRSSMDETYSKLLRSYFGMKGKKKVTFTDRGVRSDNRLKFSVSKESQNTIANTRYELYQITSGKSEFEEIVHGIGTDNDVIWEGTDCTIGFEGRWVYFGEELLCVSVAEEKADYTVFFATVKVNGKPGNLIFTYNKDKSISLEGFSEDVKMISRITPLKEGDKVTILYHDLSTDYHNPNFTDGTTFTYHPATHKLHVQQLSDGYYQYYGIVTDIYGRKSYTNTVVLNYQKGKILNFTTSSTENSALIE